MFQPFTIRALSKLGLVGWVMMRGSQLPPRDHFMHTLGARAWAQSLLGTSCFSPGVCANVELSRKPSGVGYILLGLSAQVLLFLFLFKVFIYFFWGKEGERKGGKHRRVRETWTVASCLPPTEDLARNPGMCPDMESNQ